jgi:hypothetical protein
MSLYVRYSQRWSVSTDCDCGVCSWPYVGENLPDLLVTISRCGACDGAVGWGTALQAGRSRFRFPMVSLQFFIDIILPAAQIPGIDSASNRKEYQEYLRRGGGGGEGGRCVGLTTLPPSCADCLEIWKLQPLEPLGPVQSCNGIAFNKWCITTETQPVIL